MSYGALGLVEVLGSCNAVVVLDQMLKTSNVEFRTWHTKCGGHATVFLSGDVAAVKAAVDSVKENPPCEIIAAAVISVPLVKPQDWWKKRKRNITNDKKRTFCSSVSEMRKVFFIKQGQSPWTASCFFRYKRFSYR